MSVGSWLRARRSRRALEADLARELQVHLALAVEEQQERGLSPNEARAAARRQLGNVTHLNEEMREMWGWMWLERFVQDLRYAGRTLVKAPGFTVATVTLLALGIGATTAMFSLLDAVLIRPLPFSRPERLVKLWERAPKFDQSAVAPLNLLDWSEQNHSFVSMAGVAGVTSTSLNEAAGTSQTVSSQSVTASFFDVLGVAPISGRTFVVDDANRPVVIVSERLWHRRFAGVTDLVGKPITLAGETSTVIGVVPVGFQSITSADVWTLLPLTRTPNQRQLHYLQVIARLKPGVSLPQAQADMAVVAKNIARVAPDTNAGWGVTIDPLKEAIVGTELRTTSLVLGAAVLLVLLLACANVANVLLSRGVTRTREMAVRAALGGSRGRILMQLLTEGLLLATVAGALGLLLSSTVLRLAPTFLPAGTIPESITLMFDGRLVLFAVTLTFATSLFFGAGPAWHAARIPLVEAMRHGERGATDGAGGFRAVLTVGEVAVAVLLMTGAGLLLRTLLSLDHVDGGYHATNVVSMRIGLPLRGYSPDRLRNIYQKIERDVAVIPGVHLASLTGDLPLDGFSLGWTFDLIGRDNPPSAQRVVAHYQIISPRYFDALGISLLEGRAFTDYDTATSQPVCIVNTAFARRYYSGRDPVGAQLNIPASNVPAVVREIVGVIRQVKVRPDEQQDALEIYVPIAQHPGVMATAAVQTVGSPTSVVPAITAAITRVDKGIAVTRVRTMDDVAAESTARPRFRAQLVGSFAAVAVLLAGIGVFSVLMFNVNQRRREFSIRLALGANPRDVLRVVLGQGARLIALGLAIGVGAGALLTRSLTSLLFGISPVDPMTFLSVVALLGSIAIVASAGPALRAARSDPAVALREQ